MGRVMGLVFLTHILGMVFASSLPAQLALEARGGIAKTLVDFSRDPGPSVSIAVRKRAGNMSWWEIELGLVTLASTERTFIQLDSIQVTVTTSAGNAFVGLTFALTPTIWALPVSVSIGAGIATNTGSVKSISSPVSNPSNQRENVVTPFGGIGGYVRFPISVLPLRIGRLRLGVGADALLQFRRGAGVGTFVSASVVLAIPL